MTILSKSGTWIASVESEVGVLLLFIDIVCFPDDSVEIVTSTDNSGNAEFSFPYIELQSNKYLIFFLSSNTLKLTYTNVIQCDSLQLDVFSCLRILWNDDTMKEYTSY